MIRRTNRPEFINVPLTNGAEVTLNLDTYDPATVEERKGHIRVRLRSAQILCLAMKREELDAAYERYQANLSADQRAKRIVVDAETRAAETLKKHIGARKNK